MTQTVFSGTHRTSALNWTVGFEPILARTGAVMVLTLLVTVPAYFLDDRLFQGENVWLKPIKFQVALAVYFLTLALYAHWLPARVMETARMRGLLVLAGLATYAEMLWIGGAAMFATASHYNTALLMYGIYLLMGALAVLLTSVSLALGLGFWRDRGSFLSEPFRLSLALGLILTFGLTLVAAGTLSAMPGHFIGTPVSGASLPVLGWSREVGDLRVAHFLATHALHVVPVVGLLAQAMQTPQSAKRVVWIGAIAYTGLTLFTFVQALSGRPFL
jgi:hypothetical protein